MEGSRSPSSQAAIDGGQPQGKKTLQGAAGRRGVAVVAGAGVGEMRLPPLISGYRGRRWGAGASAGRELAARDLRRAVAAAHGAGATPTPMRENGGRGR
jgi:hypothetical protein